MEIHFCSISAALKFSVGLPRGVCPVECVIGCLRRSANVYPVEFSFSCGEAPPMGIFRVLSMLVRLLFIFQKIKRRCKRENLRSSKNRYQYFFAG